MSDVKTINDIAVASVKEIKGTAIANAKTWNGVTFAVAPVGTPYYATWNPYGANTGSTFSNGYLTGDVTGNGSIRANVPLSSGKWYWEVTFDSTGSAGNTSIGVSTISAPLNNYVGQTNDGWGLYDLASLISGGYLHNGTVGAGSGFLDYTTGDVLGFALDMGAGTLAVYKNGSLMGTITGITGTVYPSFGNGGTGVHTAVTANFGATAFTYSVPSGFNSGVYTLNYDPDASYYFDYVAGLGGSLSTTEKSAYHQLVRDTKAADIYYNLLSVWPMIGASATACAVSGTVPTTNSLTFYGSPTFSSTGVQWNGSTQYADTGINAQSLSSSSNGLSYYSRTNDASSIQVEIGSSDNISLANDLVTRLSINDTYYYENPAGVTASNLDSRGLFSGHRLSGGSTTSYKNGIYQATATQSAGAPNLNIFIGVRYDGSTYQYYTKKECALAAVFQAGLTTAQEQDWYAAVQAFQTTLSRQVGTAYNQPDTDAQSFLTTAGITRPVEKYAVANYVLDLKAASVWSKIHALYPYVGATSTSCSYNLVNTAAYQMTWVGSPTFASTGVDFNGTSQWGDTGWNVFSLFGATTTDVYIGAYLRQGTTGGGIAPVDMGWLDTSITTGRVLSLNASPAVGNSIWQVSGPGTLLDTAQSAGYMSGITGTGTLVHRFNGSTLATTSVSAPTNENLSCYVGTLNRTDASYTLNTTLRETALNVIAIGMTTTDDANFYTATQAFQTVLGRQV